MNANTKAIKEDIISDILNCISIRQTHEMDYLLEERLKEFDKYFVSVLKLEFQDEKQNYYIVYKKEID